jgi:AraC-like DNA-binding protein
MHSILTALPADSLRRFVSHYTQREEVVFPTARTEPVPARIQNALEFQFDDRYEIRYFDSESVESGPCVAIVGPQTYRRTRLLIRGHMDGFVVVFRPTGFYQLFGVEMSHFVDRSYEASSVIGNEIAEIWQRLGEVSSFRQRIKIMEDFLSRRDPVPDRNMCALSHHIARNRGAIRISDLALNAGISARQLERRFRSLTGLSPKAYSRITRYESALRIKASVPARRWSTIAHELRYSDQMHMVHDFQDLSGETPSTALAHVTYGLSLNPKAWFAFSPAD